MPRARPTRDDLAHTRKELAKRSRGRGKPSVIALRLAHLHTLFSERYGDHLPDDDAGREDLRLMLDHLAGTMNERERMERSAAAWAPWMPPDELDALLAAVIAKPLRYRADTLAARLGVTNAERTRLHLWTIGAIDRTAEQRRHDRRERARLAKELKRRSAGAKPRVVYLAAEAKRLKPWRAAGVSRSAWYRARKSEAAAA